ncbi:MAG: hypothetical protein PVG93_00435 [Phycisphaerales bacterium]|jgi:hypothetical protein
MGNWGVAETEQLKELYKESNTPSDQSVKDKKALEEFVERLNQSIDGEINFTIQEVADKLFSLRKAGKLPRLRR